MLNISWLLVIAAPFLVSLCPARIFIDATKAKPIVRQYVDDLAVVLNTDEILKSVSQTCARIKGQQGNKDIATVEANVRSTCSIFVRVDSMLVIKGLKHMQGMNTTALHETCDQAERTLDSGEQHKALEQLRDTCKTIEMGIYEFNRFRSGDDSSKGTLLQGMVDYITRKMEFAVETALALKYAAIHLLSMYPVVASAARGLLEGAIMMKVVIPQSSLPGLFILVLPFLFCPVQWVLYNFICQLVGDPFLLIGWFIVSCAPFAYVVSGYQTRVHKPKEDEQVVDDVKKMRKSFRLVMMCGATLMVFFAARVFITYAHKRSYWGFVDHLGIRGDSVDWAAKRESSMIKDLIKSVVDDKFNIGLMLVGLAISVMKTYRLTCMAGVDYIILQMVEAREAEKTLLGKTWGHVDEESYSLSEHYARRMDQLLTLEDGYKDPKQKALEMAPRSFRA